MREADIAGLGAIRAEHHPGGFRAPRSQETGEADDFTGPDVEAHIADLAASRKMPDRQQRVDGFGTGRSFNSLWRTRLSSRPSMVVTRSSFEISLMGATRTVRPSRMTVTRSQTA